MAIEIITTSDGSHSLLNTDLDETYHSRHGAIQESIHIFIKRGLEYYVAGHPEGKIKLLEVGFGTGLNALLTIAFALGSPVKIEYTSLESSPIDLKTADRLNYPQLVMMDGAAMHFRQLHALPWDISQQILPGFVLEKRKEELQSCVLVEGVFDIIFYDAFAPLKQPELWDLSVLKKIEKAMKPGGIFVTYCAKGQLKRDLRSLGLLVETLPGPPGKKEMVRAVKAC